MGWNDRSLIKGLKKDLQELEEKNNKYTDEEHNTTSEYLEAAYEEAEIKSIPKDIHYKFQDIFNTIKEVIKVVNKETAENIKELSNKIKADIVNLKQMEGMDKRTFHEHLERAIQDYNSLLQLIENNNEILGRETKIRELKEVLDKLKSKSRIRKTLLDRINYHEKKINTYKKANAKIKRILKKSKNI